MSLKYTPVTQVLTYLWSWNKIKVIKPGVNGQTPRKVLMMQSFKNLSWTVSVKNPTKTFLVKSENASVICIDYVRK